MRLTSCLAWLVALAPLASVGKPLHVPGSLQDYQHTHWGQQDGAPAGIQAMARTADGWLWLGTSAGLFQFDGLTFTQRETLAANDLGPHAVRMLHAAANGDLWVFLSAGGVRVLPAGDRAHPRAMANLATVTAFDTAAEDSQGHIWATAGSHLYRSQGTTWQPVSPASVGLPDNDAPGMVDDLRGNLWYVTPRRIWVRTGSATRFVQVPGTWQNLVEIFHSTAGQVVAVDQSGTAPARLIPLAVPVGSGPVAPHSQSDQMSMDGQGVIWSVACDHGELCTARPGAATLPGAGDDPWKATGTPGPGTMSLLIDEDGSTWVGAKTGLERFRIAAATRVRLPPDTYYFAVAPQADGSIYVGTDSRTGTGSDRLWHIGSTIVAMSSSRHAVSALWQDTDGAIVVSGQDGSWLLHHHELQPWATPPTTATARPHAQAMARDAKGRFWLAYTDGETWQHDEDGWRERGDIGALPDVAVATLVPSGDMLWFGYRTNALASLDAGDRVTRWDRRQGLATGSVNVVIASTPMLVAGERALQWFDGQRFHALRARDADQLTGITGVLRDNDGALWVNGFAGLTHFTGNDVRHAMQDASFAMPGRLYDDGDGLAGAAQQQRPLPSLTRGSDGRIWVASTNGLAWLDPAALPHDLRSPDVYIRELNGRVQPGRYTRLPPQTGDIRIGFDILSLTRPDRVTVRYRLAGASSEWTDAGVRREVVFNRLPPGTYRFEVRAANADGVWNTRAAALTFVIEPTFVQTAWFKAMVAALVAMALWLLFAWRLRRERQLLRQKMAVRQVERERIARELHDTLLQGISGLLMRLQVWSGHRTLPADIRRDMERASEQGRHMLTDGRDRIAQLRANDDHPVLLADGIHAMADRLDARNGTAFVVTDLAPGTTLRHDIANEVLAIVHEAVSNAHTHAGGDTITVTLATHRTRLSVVVADDGRGIDDNDLHNACVHGRWGLVGMRERAQRIGIRLTISAGANGGTRVTLADIPCTLAPPTTFG
jgi:signal transduction histidine kinase/ligand-binding sensor domain-containing protein